MSRFIPDGKGGLIPNPSYVAPTRAQDPIMVLSTVQELQQAQETGVRIPRPLLEVIDTIDAGMLSGLSRVFEENTIPAGLMGHAIALRHYNHCFLVDDSGSMSNPSDLFRRDFSRHMSGSRSGSATRWEDAQDRMHRMIDLLTYVPTGPITIQFLNHRVVINLDRRRKTPEQFAAEAHATITRTFSDYQPDNTTPLLSRLRTVLDSAMRSQVATALYVITDGIPDGPNPSEPGEDREESIEAIQTLLLLGARAECAQKYPVTFIDCTNEPRQTEWTRELEEESESGRYMLYVAAVEDFSDEQRQVLQFQGQDFPYNRGLWILACLAAALDPNGLDAMNQPEPLTKAVFDCLLGRVHSDEEYLRYFCSHGYATQFFKEDYQLFLGAQTEGEIPSVIEFRNILSQLLKRDIKNKRDNTELLEIANAGQQVCRLRLQGQFDAGNRQLLATIGTRMAQQLPTRPQPYETAYLPDVQQPLMGAAAAGGAAPYGATGSVGYTPADGYKYPTAPVMGYVMQSGQTAQSYTPAYQLPPTQSTQWQDTFAGSGGRGASYQQPRYDNATVPAYTAATNNNDDCCPCVVQ